MLHERLCLGIASSCGCNGGHEKDPLGQQHVRASARLTPKRQECMCGAEENSSVDAVPDILANQLAQINLLAQDVLPCHCQSERAGPAPRPSSSGTSSPAHSLRSASSRHMKNPLRVRTRPGHASISREAVAIPTEIMCVQTCERNGRAAVGRGKERMHNTWTDGRLTKGIARRQQPAAGRAAR